MVSMLKPQGSSECGKGRLFGRQTWALSSERAEERFGDGLTLYILRMGEIVDEVSERVLGVSRHAIQFHIYAASCKLQILH